MLETILEWLVAPWETYLVLPQWAQVWIGIGAAVWLGFVTVGLNRVPGGRGSSIPFRVLIFPSVAVLWPIVVYRWVRGEGLEEGHG